MSESVPTTYVTAKVLKAFFDRPTGKHVQAGDKVTASTERHAQLARNGLVEGKSHAVSPAKAKPAAKPVPKAIVSLTRKAREPRKLV